MSAWRPSSVGRAGAARGRPGTSAGSSAGPEASSSACLLVGRRSSVGILPRSVAWRPSSVGGACAAKGRAGTPVVGGAWLETPSSAGLLGGRQSIVGNRRSSSVCGRTGTGGGGVVGACLFGGRRHPVALWIELSFGLGRRLSSIPNASSPASRAAFLAQRDSSGDVVPKGGTGVAHPVLAPLVLGRRIIAAIMARALSAGACGGESFCR